MLMLFQETNQLGSGAITFEDVTSIESVSSTIRRSRSVRSAADATASFPACSTMRLEFADRGGGSRLRFLERCDTVLDLRTVGALGLELRRELHHPSGLLLELLLQDSDTVGQIRDDPFVLDRAAGQLVFADAGGLELALQGLDAFIARAEQRRGLRVIGHRGHRLELGDLRPERVRLVDRLVQPRADVVVRRDLLVPIPVSAVFGTHHPLRCAPCPFRSYRPPGWFP